MTELFAVKFVQNSTFRKVTEVSLCRMRGIIEPPNEQNSYMAQQALKDSKPETLK